MPNLHRSKSQKKTLNACRNGSTAPPLTPNSTLTPRAIPAQVQKEVRSLQSFLTDPSRTRATPNSTSARRTAPSLLSRRGTAHFLPTRSYTPTYPSLLLPRRPWRDLLPTSHDTGIAAVDGVPTPRSSVGIESPQPGGVRNELLWRSELESWRCAWLLRCWSTIQRGRLVVVDLHRACRTLLAQIDGSTTRELADGVGTALFEPAGCRASDLWFGWSWRLAVVHRTINTSVGKGTHGFILEFDQTLCDRLWGRFLCCNCQFLLLEWSALLCKYLGTWQRFWRARTGGHLYTRCIGGVCGRSLESTSSRCVSECSNIIHLL